MRTSLQNDVSREGKMCKNHTYSQIQERKSVYINFIYSQILWWKNIDLTMNIVQVIKKDAQLL